VLQTLCQDPDARVREEAHGNSIENVRVFVRDSVLPDQFHELGQTAFSLLGQIASDAPRARLWSRIVTQLELVRDDLSRSPDLGGAVEASAHVRQLHERLVNGSLTARLWHWVGPSSREVDVMRSEDDPRVSAAIEALANELVSNAQVFRSHVEWLTGDEAEYRVPLFERLGEHDRGGPLFQILLEARAGRYWPVAFGAYCVGWSRKAAGDVDLALDRLADDAGLHRGVLAATAWLLPSERSVERLIRLVTGAGIPRADLAREAALSVPWAALTASQAERLLQALDDGTHEVRSTFLHARLRDARDAELTPSLREFTWLCLDTTARGETPLSDRSWDFLAAKLGRQEPARLREVVWDALTSPGAARRTTLLQDRLSHSWRALRNADRPGTVQMLLDLAVANGPSEVARDLQQVIDPAQDRDALLHWAQETGPPGVAVVADSLDPDRPGFWGLARELLIRWGDDPGVGERLLAHLHTGSWSGSAVPMIDDRLSGGRELVTDPDWRVAAWAQRAVNELEGWRRREQREDEEDWIWDNRISRAEIEGMLAKHDSPERLWAIGRLLKDAPEERVRELLSPAEILEALPKLDYLDRRTTEKWEAWARHRSERR
jgi:hypothetical protein